MSQSLPKVPLGKTGLSVTRLGYGAMELRGPRIWNGRPVSDAEAAAVLNAVLDAGINFIDTSNDYGRSEEFIGKFLSGRRQEFFLATKCGCNVTRKDEHTDDTPHLWTKTNLFRGLHESLERLKTDYVDLVQLHNPPFAAYEQNGLLEALEEMKRRGHVRHIGVSMTLPDLPLYLKTGVFETFQIPYSALQREHDEWITQAGEAGCGTIIRGGVARGTSQNAKAGVWNAFESAKLDELREQDESRAAFLFRYTLSHPHAHTIIVGTLRPGHLAENLRTLARGPLPSATFAEARRRLIASEIDE